MRLRRTIEIPEDTGLADEVVGFARLDRKTKNLVKRLRPGEIAIIDHEDIDRVSAEALTEARPAAVVNTADSLTGRYPNLGPLVIAASGIKIIDDVGDAVFDLLEEGTMVSVRGSALYVEEKEIARGRLLTVDRIEELIERSKANLGSQLSDFATNTLELLEAEKEILLETVDLPQIRTNFRGRSALVVVRGHDYKRDLKALRPYVREMKPVMVAVDGGADALRELRYEPDMIVGDMDSVTDGTLRSGAELVVHGYPSGEAPGRKRLEEMALPYTVFHYPGTSEDIAMLIAYEKGAELIVVVGGHTSLVEFMDKDRKGMASTFLVRLRVGAALVDAKGVSRIYKQRVRAWHLIVMVLAALAAISIIIVLSEPVRQFITLLAMRLQVWIMRLQNLI